MLLSINWSYSRGRILPIIKVQGQSHIKESEFLILNRAVEIIELARKFKAIPYASSSRAQSSNFLLTVSFSLFFFSRKKLDHFVYALLFEGY